MDRLISVIGPAPSERSWESWLRRLGVERERVSKELALFRAGLLTKGKRKIPSVKKAKVKKESVERKIFLRQLSLLGMSEEEYDEKVKERRED